MDKGAIKIYYGEGQGKSTAAFGNAVRAAGNGNSVIIIQFLKVRDEQRALYTQRLEPEIKIFNFAKADCPYEQLDEEKRHEEMMNLRNGFNYAKKVITTEACDLLVLDEILGLVDEEVITYEEFKELLEVKPEDMRVICTGRTLDDRMRELADEICNIVPEK